MRAVVPVTLSAMVALLMLPATASASNEASASVTVSAQFASRTSLQVSAQVMRFEIVDPLEPAIASVEFSAGARTAMAEEVVLSFESGALVTPVGAAEVETAIHFSGEGDGVASGGIQAGSPTVAGRWVGSGKRTGRLVFSLRSDARGEYSLPVMFSLSTP